RYNTCAFVADDPVQFPRRFSDARDIEIAAFLVSTIAWGNRKQIINSCRKMLFSVMEGRPYDFIMGEGWRDIDPSMNIHRTFFGRDLIYMCRGFFAVYKRGSFEDLFRQRDVWDGIMCLRETFFSANGEYTKHISQSKGSAYKDGSACKRINLMLRWLCRDDGMVDLGIWKALRPSELMIPLDVHVARTGRELGLIERKQNDRITVEQLTARLREYCAEDPIKYDFALFGVGEFQKH
ncbi:MAG: TIGR02757 family protein, partial [Tannerellaceae bacterium]|nr:TIGR02757 family protein [Tannerellaceae bacterium]